MLRNRWARGWVVLWALLQFALPTMATYADALLERSALDATAHVESDTAAACPAAHPSDCALCQLVHRGASAATAGCIPLIAVVVSPAHQPLGSQAMTAERGRLPLSRAPPAV